MACDDCGLGFDRSLRLLLLGGGLSRMPAACTWLVSLVGVLSWLLHLGVLALLSLSRVFLVGVFAKGFIPFCTQSIGTT